MFKESLLLMCLVRQFDIIGTWKVNVVHRDIFYAKKILNIFVSAEDKILVKKWNLYEAHIFPRPLHQTCRLETISFCLNTRLRVNKKFNNSQIFIEINVNFCLLCAYQVMTSIILHTRRPNGQYKVSYALGFYVSADFIFSYFEKLKSTFFTSLHFALRVIY